MNKDYELHCRPCLSRYLRRNTVAAGEAVLRVVASTDKQLAEEVGANWRRWRDANAKKPSEVEG